MSDEARCTVTVTIHPWCRSPSRDEAVRASEDGRKGPLPTLEAVIAQPFADEPKCSPSLSKTGEGQSGLRTERVTLEITHNSDDWMATRWWWSMIVKRFAPEIKSVRVVEESHFDDLAQVAMERDAAIRERDKLRGEITSLLDRSEFASTELTRLRNRVAELESAPAASGAAGTATWFAAVGKFGMRNVCMAFNSFEECEKFADGEVRIVCLYDRPQPASGWLTAEERKLLGELIGNKSNGVGRQPYTGECGIVRELLAREMPPEVVLPLVATWGMDGYAMLRRAEVQEAIAAAGVPWKEVAK